MELFRRFTTLFLLLRQFCCTSGNLELESLLTTALYDYTVQSFFQNKTVAQQTPAPLEWTLQLQVSQLWAAQNDVIHHVELLGVEKISMNLTNHAFLQRFQTSSSITQPFLTVYLDQSETPFSRLFKSSVARHFATAFNATRAANVVSGSSLEWTRQDRSNLLLRPTPANGTRPFEQKRHRLDSRWIVQGSGKRWTKLTAVEVRSLLVPWLDAPVQDLETRVTVVQKGSIPTPDNVLQLRGTSGEDTLSKCQQFIPQNLENYSDLVLDESMDYGDIPNSNPKKDSLLDKIQVLQKYMRKSQAATVNASRAFLLLHKAIRKSEKGDITAALKNILKLKKKQQSPILFLLDAIAAHQTLTGLDAVMEVLDYTKKPAHRELFQRYLMASSFATRGNELVIRKLLEILDGKALDFGLEETIGLALGALAHTLTRFSPANSEMVKELNSLVSIKFAANLGHCGSTGADGDSTAACRVKWLRALGNQGHADMTNLILFYVKQGGRPGPAAIRALRRLPPDHLTHTIRASLWNVYENSSAVYDSSCKVSAINWLIEHGDNKVENISRIIQGLAKQRTTEVRTYLMAALSNTIQDGALLRESFRLAAEQNRQVNYAELGSLGQSIAYQGVMSQKQALNATYSLAIEFSGGSMKTSAVAVNLHGHNNCTASPIISFGLFSRGLASFMGSTSEEADDASETATAGLNLELLDISLPSVVFFNGLSELMSLALSAGGFDPVAEMQFNILLQQSRDVDFLSSGVPVVTTTMTALSADLSGYVQVSLWGRTFNSLVRNQAALATETTTKIGYPDQKKLRHTVEERVESKMDFVTNVDFSTFPVKLCMQMKHSPILYRRFDKSWSLAKGTENDALVVSRRHSRSVSPAKSFFLGSKNAQFCRQMESS